MTKRVQRGRKSRLELVMRSRVATWWWRLHLTAERIGALVGIFAVLCREPALRTRQGFRFLEMKYLLSLWLTERTRSVEACAAICAEFDNVLRRCDVITYDEDGAADAYVILHFLDRFHRFQMILNALEKQGHLPSRSCPTVLDVGTGPGPSMFATSDQYQTGRWRASGMRYDQPRPAIIDYAEKSDGFRHWLHHFTELANYRAPSGIGWSVPFHHGSITDFAEITFDRIRRVWDRDEDGEEIVTEHVEKVRPDLIVMSNFLTTETQAKELAPRIRDCARHLRNGGILLVVGARSDGAKYRKVYDVIDEAVLGCHYSRRGFRAWCSKIELSEPVMGYDYADPWGRQLKQWLVRVRKSLRGRLGGDFPAQVDTMLKNSTDPSYDHQLWWEVRAYRKHAHPLQNGKAAARTKRLVAPTANVGG